MSALDRYQIQNLLGQGGMGSVYRAVDGRTNETVAIKLLHRSSPRARERMLREIRSMAALNHRGIVRVRDAGSHEGSPFLVLDFVEGETLTERLLREGPLTWYAAAELGRDLGEALEHAHSQGIVHRDVKPDNVLLDARGAPRLTDFGLSTQGGDEEQRLTLSGALLGTPGFLAPEQAEGKREHIGAHSDVYGLGGVIYFALTGRAPIEGTSLPALISATVDRRPTPPHELNAAAGRPISKLCMRCLAKNPALRPTADAVVAELEALLAGDSRKGPPVAVWAALGLVGLLAVGGGWAAGRLNSDDSQPKPTQVEPPPDQPLDSPPERPLASTDDPPPRVGVSGLPLPAESPAVHEHCERARTLLTSREFAAAHASASEATRIDPHSVRGWFFRGVSSLAMGDPEAGLRQLNRAAEYAPNRPSILVNRAMCLIQLRRSSEALPLLTRSIEGQDIALSRVQRAGAYAELGRNDLALIDLRRAFELKLESADVFNALAIARSLDAEPEVELALSLLPQFDLSNDPKQLRERLDELGVEHSELILRDTALLLESSPNDPKLLVLRARAFISESRPAEALETTRRIPVDAKQHLAALELDAIAHYYVGNLEQSVASWRAMEERNVARGIARLYCVLSLVRLGRIDEAHEVFAAEPSVIERNPPALGVRAVLHNTRGEHEACLKDFETALALNLREPWLFAAAANSQESLGQRKVALTTYEHVLTSPRLNPTLATQVKARVAALRQEFEQGQQK